ncbi:MAG: amino acid permease, partial [Pseudomonas sp.]|nr:amino acid permease [Pseudomonas sp.]
RELLLFLLCPLIGLVADLWLMVSLDHLAVWLGLSWLAIGVVYLAVLTSGFRRQPPELDFQEAG